MSALKHHWNGWSRDRLDILPFGSRELPLPATEPEAEDQPDETEGDGCVCSATDA